MSMAISDLSDSLAKNGCKCRVVSIARLKEIENTLSELKSSGEIASDFYPEIIKYFKFYQPSALADARSIIIVASPQLPARVVFGSRKAIIPPTYIYREIWKDQLKLVKDFLEPRGY